ncbi:MAG: hypothetical protein LBO06_06720 [Bacteroidales bacterium]|nr:hypothetical protein [Bacteroidales bacterium]
MSNNVGNITQIDGGGMGNFVQDYAYDKHYYYGFNGNPYALNNYTDAMTPVQVDWKPRKVEV